MGGNERRVPSSIGRQSSSKSRTEPALSFPKTKLVTSFLINSRSENPSPNAYDVTSTRRRFERGPTFGEGRRYMYDRRAEIDSLKLGPGDYYNAKHLTSSGPAVTINSRDRDRDVISGNDARYTPNITFSRHNMQDIPGPARYDTIKEKPSRRKRGASLRKSFIKSTTRPSWCAKLEDLNTNQDDRSNRPLTSSMGHQTISQNVSLPSHRFGRSYRVSPDLWISSPDVFPSPSLTPGVGHYRFDAAFALGPQKLSHNTSAPSHGFTRSKRFESRSYFDHADRTRRYGGIRRMRRHR